MRVRAVFQQQAKTKKLLGEGPKYHGQRRLADVLHSLFPDSELDFWIPSLRLAFEYQDPHHYVSTWYSDASPTVWESRDTHLAARGDTFVSVPCWWDGSHESLKSTIEAQRNGIFPDTTAAAPIPERPPDHFFDHLIRMVPGVGELMQVSFPNNDQIEFTEWWCSEKYDGIRACWQPLKKILYSRYGRDLFIPKHLCPATSVFLDGEIWFGRGNFRESMDVFAHEGNVEWVFMRYLVFDSPLPSPSPSSLPAAPASPSSSLPASPSQIPLQASTPTSSEEEHFEARFASVLKCTATANFTILPVSNVACVSNLHVQRSALEIMRERGEGIVLRAPRSPYVHGRSSDVVKVKATRDQEGLITAISDDNDTCTISLPNGIDFEAPAPRKLDLEAGDVVSFGFSAYSKRQGIPLNPQIYRKRPDVSWGDMRTMLTEKRLTMRTDLTFRPPKRIGFWTTDESLNIRKFLENFARERNFDPGNADHWYHVSHVEFLRAGGSAVLHHFKDSRVKMLIAVFPDIGLQEHKFNKMSSKYWDKTHNRRDFLDRFAAKRGIDPLVPQNWYSVTTKDIGRDKGGSSMMVFCGGRLNRILSDAYPHLSFEQHKFRVKLEEFWTKSRKRQFFDNYARRHAFDPLVADKWYNISRKSVVRENGTLLRLYGGSLIRALIDVYPDIGLERDRFFYAVPKPPRTQETRRRFFDAVAKEEGFDPLVPANWYPINCENIRCRKGAMGEIEGLGGSVLRAVLEAYPDIGLQEHLFSHNPAFFQSKDNRRKFLERYAAEKQFDPLVAENWYSIQKSSILHMKGAHAFLDMYNNSITRALIDVLPNINLEELKFKYLPRHYWSNAENRRQFFIRFAKRSGFDPLLPENWYQLTKSKLHHERGFSSISEYHSGSLGKALVASFPNIGLDEKKIFVGKV